MGYLALILGIFGLELGVKDRIEKTKKEGTYEKKLGGLVSTTRYHNRGAVLNVGQAKQKAVAALSVVLTALLTIFFIITLGHAGNGLLKTGLSLLLGGAYSNTYDRLTRKHVVDYICFNVPWKWLQNIVFNIGDFCIIIGAMLCVIGMEKE